MNRLPQRLQDAPLAFVPMELDRMMPSWDALLTPAALPFMGVPAPSERPVERLTRTPERSTEGQAQTAAQRRKARFLERRNALQFAVEVRLIALGFGIMTAAKVAALALKLNWQRARDEMRKFGYSYLDMCWV